MTGTTLPRNKLSILDQLKIAAVLVPTPVVMSAALIKSFFTEDGRAKSWKRVIADSTTAWIVSNINRRQVRGVFGETGTVYRDFVKAKGLTPVIEELGHDSRLLWLGPRKSERVILYLHGGAFLFGALPSTPYFWTHTQDVIAKNGKEVDVAMLNYTLVPDAMFPTQLKQAVLAIQHLISTGIKPENIQLAGDSAGGALIHEVLSHLLHPVPDVPKLVLSAPLGGAYLMSPWTSLKDSPMLRSNQGRGDILTLSTVVYWGSKVLDGVPESGIPYLDGISAPEDWFKGIDKVVKRILISAGDAEVFRDTIIKYTKTVEKYHKDVTFFLDEHGVHDDPFLHFLVGEPNRGKLTPFIIDWLDKGFNV
ncbi:Putative steryl acetyl hydrolase mug81 [Psilocybe cubensis]|uniref:Steryl acetyl hydrolase mug81 n=2 Tax=Psilocybe cubensis TaxID=181762 RepID=A0ACB8GN40_PSICU|nr:Putative steryl acetyl hydrolase mug81 [Psilocybe cubensis]KAH9476880.1 Putative steryl acetyl hydrolase mug81 [Psilocybe cubensis]